VKHARSILLSLAAAAMTVASTAASAQDTYAAPADPRIEQVRTDADNARRRESDLAARIAEQDRINASIRDQLRKVDTDPAGLLRDLVDVSDQAAALRKKVADQRQRRDAAEDKLNDARARAMDRYEQTQSMVSARRAFEDAAAELDHLSQPILEQLSQDPGYQEAQALVDAAAQAGEALQSFPNVDPKAQADADSAFDNATARVHEMEDAAVDADPRAAEAHKTVRIAQDTLEGLRMENEKKIKTDPAVDAAQFALDLEQKLLDDSTADLSVAERRLSALRQTTQPNAGPPTELANQLKEGEARLRDLNDQLDQARVARQDAEDRLRYAQGGQPATGGDIYQPAPSDYPPPLEPSDDGYYDGGGYYSYGGSYGYPYYSYRTYSYPAYGYRPYLYDPFYCPPYYSSFLGFGLSFGSFYRHSYDRPYYYAYDYRRFHDDRWRNRYDYWRGRDGFRDGRSSVAFRDGRSTFGSDRRYDYSRFNRTEIGRDRTARSSLDRARLSTADSERDYRYRSGVTTYNYPGSTPWRQRESEQASVRARQYEMDARERRSAAASESDVRRAGISSESRTSSARLAAERSSSDDSRRREAADSAARRADESSRAAEATRTRTDWRPRTSADETRGTRPNEDFRRSGGSSSSSGDAARARASDSERRSRASDAAPPPPSRSSRGSDAPVAAPSRSRGSDAAPNRGSSRSEPAPSRGSSRSEAPAPSRGSSRSESFSPPPSFRGGGGGRDYSPPSGGGSGRGSARGGDSSPPPSVSPSRGSSGSSSGSSRGGGSSGGGGGSRGRR
jgi:hypothetical protein